MTDQPILPDFSIITTLNLVRMRRAWEVFADHPADHWRAMAAEFSARGKILNAMRCETIAAELEKE